MRFSFVSKPPLPFVQDEICTPAREQSVVQGKGGSSQGESACCPSPLPLRCLLVPRQSCWAGRTLELSSHGSAMKKDDDLAGLNKT